MRSNLRVPTSDVCRGFARWRVCVWALTAHMLGIPVFAFADNTDEFGKEAVFFSSVQIDQAMDQVDRAYALYLDGQAKKALAELEPQFHGLSFDQSATAYVRTQSLYAGLLVMMDDVDEGYRIFKALFELDLSDADQTAVALAQVHYATTLYRVGEVAKSVLLFQQAVRYGLRNGQDRIALTAGANLSSYLSSKSMFGESSYWIKELRPAMNRNPNLLATATLFLVEVDTLIKTGNLEEALVLALALVDVTEKHNPVLLGNCYEMLSVIYRRQDQSDKALIAARKGVEYEGTDSAYYWNLQLREAQALIGLKRYDDATEILNQIVVNSAPDASTFEAFRAAQFEARLGQVGDDSVRRELDLWKQAMQQHYASLYVSQEEYYEAKVSSQALRSSVEISRMQQSVDVAEDEVEDLRRNLLIAGIIAAGIISVLLVYGRLSRRIEREKVGRAMAERHHMEVVGMLTGNLAHDFNNILQVTENSNELIMNEAKSRDRSGKILDILATSNKSVNTGRRMIRQLLAYSRQQMLEVSEFDIKAYIEENRSLFESVVGESNDLLISMVDERIQVALDQSQLTAALLNLLKNAADAMESTGSITLNVSAVKQSKDELSSEQPLESGVYAKIQVVDSGVGMTPDQLRQAKEPFFTTKGAEFGTGLGLSSVYGFVHQSGGELQIESWHGFGTTVSMLFPTVDHAAEEQWTPPVK